MDNMYLISGVIGKKIEFLISKAGVFLDNFIALLIKGQNISLLRKI